MTFCVLGENCSVFDRHTKTSGVSLRNPLCEGCRNRARRELDLLRFDYLDLSQIIAKAGGFSEVKIAHAKPESSPTIDISVFTLRSQMAMVACSAERAVRIRLGMLHPSAPVREGFGLSDAVHFLLPRVDDLARLPAWPGDWGVDVGELDGGQILMLLGSLHRRSRRMCGIDPRTIAIPGLCPRCSVPALRRNDDDPQRLWCAHCYGQFTQSEYFAAQRMQFAPVTPTTEGR